MNQDWDELEALRDSLREHMAEIHRLRAAGRQALDALCLPCDRWNRRQTEIINASITTLRVALAEDVPPDSKELNETSLNKLVEDIKNLGPLNKFRPTHMLFNAKALEYCKKLAEERDAPETNFGSMGQGVDLKRNDIIRMAREAGIDAEQDTLCRYEGWVEPLKRFAALVAAAEREACAQACIETGATKGSSDDALDMADSCAAAIRARNEK